jgi:hypothetical protein
MRVLRIVCLFACVWSVASGLAGLAVSRQGSFGTIFSFASAFVCAAGFYGIQKRAPITWVLGWAVIAACFSAFLFLALPAAIKVPKADHPWIATAGVLLGTAAVALYWSFWWKRQKPYFEPRPRKTGQ